MATNRTHRENPEEVINSLIYGDSRTSASFLIFSIGKFLNNEIRLTTQQNPPQTSLMFMGTHGAILTVAEVLFNKKALAGYRKFLEEFMDEELDDRKFSLVAEQIHAWRNILVHGWISLRGHSMEYDYSMEKGHEVREGTLYINPKIYLRQYLNAFEANGKILNYIKRMSREDLKKAQEVIKQKYTR